MKTLAAIAIIGTLTGLQFTQAITIEEARSRLQGQRDSPQYGRFFQETLHEVDRIAAAADLLLELGDSIPEEDIRLELMTETAQAAELAGASQAAHQLYRRIRDLRPNDTGAMLGYAATALEMGNLQEAILAAENAINHARLLGHQKQAARIRVRAFALQGADQIALLHSRSLAAGDDPSTVAPEDLYLLHQMAVLNDQLQLAEETQERLATMFPDSPEAASAINASNTRPFTSPSEILLAAEMPRPNREPEQTEPPRSAESTPADGATAAPESAASADANIAAESTRAPENGGAAGAREQPRPQADEERGPDPTDGTTSTSPGDRETKRSVVGVQTGSFRNRDNAQYMASDLQELGFSTRIDMIRGAQGAPFYRVIVPVGGESVEQAQQLVVRLKEQGIEGFLLFQE